LSALTNRIFIKNKTAIFNKQIAVFVAVSVMLYCIRADECILSHVRGRYISEPGQLTSIYVPFLNLFTSAILAFLPLKEIHFSSVMTSLTKK